jgi:hypothetical protein
MSFSESPYAMVLKHVLMKRSATKMIYGGKGRLINVHTFDSAHIRGYCHLELILCLDKAAAASSSPLPL